MLAMDHIVVDCPCIISLISGFYGTFMLGSKLCIFGGSVHSILKYRHACTSGKEKI